MPVQVAPLRACLYRCNVSIDFRLYLITDRRLTDNLPHVIEEALKAGVDAFQIREKDLSARELVTLTEELLGIARRYNAKVFINDRVDIAMALNLSGVHLPAGGLPVEVVKRISGGRLLTGVSTHSLEEAIKAEEGGADFITFGPVYETPSKLSFGPPKGLGVLKEVVSKVRIPVFAIGGINITNLREVMDTGVHGIALISAIMASKRPGDEARRLLDEIRRIS